MAIAKMILFMKSQSFAILIIFSVYGCIFSIQFACVQEQILPKLTNTQMTSNHFQNFRADFQGQYAKNKVFVPQVVNHTNIPNAQKRIGPDGQSGYTHDPRFLLNQKQKSTITKEVNKCKICEPPGEGSEGIEGFSTLERIRHHIESSKASRNVTLFCAVYTYKGGIKFTDAIKDTWGKRCDGLLFASDESNSITGHTLIPSNSIYGFGYNGMTQRTRAILAYLYDNFLTSFDFFHICGDDTYLIVENLKEFLFESQAWENSNKNNDRYVFAGFLYSWGSKKHEQLRHYLGGGSGYTLSAKALKAYAEGPLQVCETSIEGPNEDVHVSNCFYNYLSTDW
eukprot:CAMPEP_0176485022 /NCGR_PEP_ID=MMETSP0200_2-20121128/4821_1 /TAXON_ID=947934 /ORGANISM="Chaetoceros sp., Strain GSL56" /LENGTH=338 /DNA_ID=CAMNT_0017881645 /DNA_START=45 /DNA_END=1058 /DNA_ORIENTATION=+